MYYLKKISRWALLRFELQTFKFSNAELGFF